MVHSWTLGRVLVWKDPGQGILAVVTAVDGSFIHAFSWKVFIITVLLFPVSAGHITATP